MLGNNALLINGGTGSFGNAVLRRFLQTAVREIRTFSRNEKRQGDLHKRLASEVCKVIANHELTFLLACEENCRRAVEAPVMAGSQALGRALEQLWFSCLLCLKRSAIFSGKTLGAKN